MKFMAESTTLCPACQIPLIQQDKTLFCLECEFIGYLEYIGSERHIFIDKNYNAPLRIKWFKGIPYKCKECKKRITTKICEFCGFDHSK